MLKILSIHSGPHDSAAAVFQDYELLAAVQQERLTRKKCVGGFPKKAIDEVLAISGFNKQDIDVIVLTRGSYPTTYLNYGLSDRIRFSLQWKKGQRRHKSIASHMRKNQTENAHDVFNKSVFCKENGFSEDVILHFSNHHNAHALSALFYLPGDNVLAYTSDGGGDGVYYSARIANDKNELACLFGDDRYFATQNYTNSLALAYGYSTEACGFRRNRHEGKLTGLAAYGEPSLYDEMASHYTVLDTGEVDSDFTSNNEMKQEILRISKGQPHENIAASVQKLLEVFTVKSLKTIMKNHHVERLALAGGAFANVRLNKLICEETGIKEIFIAPAMGDEGLVIGGALEYLQQHFGDKNFLANRRRMKSVYLANEYETEITRLFKQDDRFEAVLGEPAEVAAEMIANDKIGAIYTGRMEFGPRALGARSISASPKDDGINKTLNKRLQRTEFMPFAPYVLEEDARDVFDISDVTHYACEFMTISNTCSREVGG
ncbi:MAG: carbamoyltransferase N-terminal domain-containing protein [Gammaproteobacteria bacterium]|nr:carbamoyltransferase N-terminal domain-containing protein [Gammaproteobacteria bacterium]